MRTPRSMLPLCIVFAAAVTGGALRAADPDPEYAVDVYWTDAPPALDGQMQEACWQDARVVTDFRMFQKADMRPTQQTEVRLCYDAENLYLFWTLHEKDMASLVYGPPEDFRDLMPFKDVVELFLDPGRTREYYVQLAASPMGTRFDLSRKQHTRFNPEWRVKPGIHADHWTLEMAIPFRELVQPGEFLLTPSKGDVWGVQFCRDQARRHEWSHWRPTSRSFHEVDKFGTLVFQGRKTGKALPVVRRTDEMPLGFGPGAIALSVEDAATPSAKGVLREQGGKEAPVAVEGTAAAPRLSYRILQGGLWALDGEVVDGGTPIATFRALARLPQVAETIAEARKNLDASREKLAAFAHPAAAELKAEAAKLDKALQAPHAALRKAAELDREAWAKVVAQSEEVTALWNAMAYDLFRVQTYPAGEADRAFAVATVDPLKKIYPQRRFDGPVEKPIRLALAGDERESFQLVLVPFWQALETVSVVVSDLKGDGGAIPASAARWFRVDYVRMEGVDPESPVKNEIEPDILMPGAPFAQPADEQRALFVDIHAPRGTPAGEYRGAVTVNASGQSVSIPLTVEVYGFDLPRVSSIENNFWFSPDHGWRKFYGSFGESAYPLAIYEKHAEALSRYRLTCYADSWIHMWEKMTVYHEPDGSFTFDFSEWEKMIRIGKKYGSNSLRASFGCNTASLLPFIQPWRKIIERTTGEEKTIKDFVDTEDWWKRLAAGEVSWTDHPVYMAYLEQYVKFLERMGVLETAYWEVHDEPNSIPRWLGMIKDHTFLRNHAPRLRLMNFGMHPLQRKAEEHALGLVDTWAPHLTAIDEEVLATIHERRARFGEKFWFYTCTEGRDKAGNVTPFTYYHRPYMGPRITAWMAWKMQADGFLIFALSGVPDANVVKKDEEKPRWPESPWSDGKYRGCGTLIYPGPDYELIPSMRLASLRDGLEDYDYFHLLHEQWSYLSSEDHPELYKRIERELTIEPEIVKSHFVWTRETERLDAKRARLAALIVEASAISGVGRSR